MPNQKILLIEDDEILSKVLEQELREEKFDVTQAFDGEAGLEAAQRMRFDLILLDVILPKKNGFAVLETLQASAATKDMPVLMLTMLGSEEDIRRSVRLGARGHIVKSHHAVADIIKKVQTFFATEKKTGKK